jgi:hypothetical protein
LRYVVARRPLAAKRDISALLQWRHISKDQTEMGHVLALATTAAFRLARWWNEVILRAAFKLTYTVCNEPKVKAQIKQIKSWIIFFWVTEEHRRPRVLVADGIMLCKKGSLSCVKVFTHLRSYLCQHLLGSEAIATSDSVMCVIARPDDQRPLATRVAKLSKNCFRLKQIGWKKRI